MKRLVILSLLCALPGLAWAGENPSAQVRARAAARGLGAAQVDALLAPLQRASQAGLPMGPVADKVLEGLAKGVPPARIADAAGAVVTRLDDARSALELAQSATVRPDQSHAVEALALAENRLGSRGALMLLAASARGSSPEGLVAAASAAADLRAEGAAPEQALPAVGHLAAQGYRPEQVAAVSRLFQAYRREGGADPGAFFDELGRRSAQRAEIGDMIDPFGSHGDVLRHAPQLGDALASPLSRPGNRAQGGRSLVENPDREGSTPANDEAVGKSQGKKPPVPPGRGGERPGRGAGNPAGIVDE